MKEAWRRLEARLEMKKPETWKFIKWCAVTNAVNVLDVGLYYILLALMTESFQRAPIGGPLWWQNFLATVGLNDGLGILIAFLFSISLGYVLEFIINRKLVFKANNGVALSSLLYALNALLVIVVGSWFGTWFTMLLVNRGASAVLIALLPKPLQVALPMLWSYPANRLIVFTQKKEQNNGNSNDANNIPAG